VPISSRTEFAPIQRSLLKLLRNKLRRRFDRLAYRSLATANFHYSDHQDFQDTNRGDIAIRLASVGLLRQAFGEVEIVEVGWHELGRLDPGWINRHIDLFVIGGEGYYYLHPEGMLAERVKRDLHFLRQIRCPIASLSPGVNRLLKDDQAGRVELHPSAHEVLRELVRLLTLSSVRSDFCRNFLDLVRPGHTVTMADPVLFLSPAVPHMARPEAPPDTLAVGLNMAFHGQSGSHLLPGRLRLMREAARELARRQPCRFFYFVHHDTERMIPDVLRNAGVPVTAIDMPPAEMLGCYKWLDIHICHMLHSSMFSFNAGVPTINLGYDVKNAAFFELMGLSEYCMPADRTSAAELDAALAALIDQHSALKHRIIGRKAELRRDLDAFLADMVRLVCLPAKSTWADHAES
jgi:Polysaccharide pyruvyl transferase